MKISLYIFSLIIASFSGFSQYLNNGNFVELDGEEIGLNKVKSVKWDSLNRLWAITREGLVVYDGYDIKLQKYDSTDSNSILGNKIFNLSQGNKNELWITYSGISAVSKYEIDLDRYTHYFADTLNKSTGIDSTTFMVRVVRGKTGRVWIPTWGHGLIELDEGSGEFKAHKFQYPSDTVPRPIFMKNIGQLKNGKLVVGFFSESQKEKSMPVIFDPETKDFEPINFKIAIEKIEAERLRKIIKISLRIVNFVHVDKDDNIWFGTYSGLLFYDRKNETIERVTDQSDLLTQNRENASSYIVYNDEIWVTTPNIGIMVANMKTKAISYHQEGKNRTQSLSDNRISSISLDPQNNIWVITTSGKINIYVPSMQHFKTHQWEAFNFSFTNRAEQAIPVHQMTVRKKDDLVYLSHNEGLSVYDPKKGKVVDELNIPTLNEVTKFGYTKLVKDFKFIGDDKILLTWNDFPAIYTISKRKLDFYRLRPNQIIPFRHAENDTNHLFITNRNVKHHSFFYQIDTNKHIPGKEVNDIDSLIILPKNIKISNRFSLKMPSGSYLFSLKWQPNQLIVIDPDQSTHKLLNNEKDKNNFPKGIITMAYLSKNEKVWIGSSEGLFQYLPEENHFIDYSDTLGLAANRNIKSIVEDENNVFWIALERNIISWDPKTNLTRKFGKEDGLLVNEFLPSIGQTDSEGNVYFVTTQGLLTFSPDELKIERYDFKLILSRLIINDSSTVKNDFSLLNESSIVFDWNENFLEFEFATNQVFGVTPHQFKYRLKGFEERWIDNGTSNRIRFPNLPYGNYQLEVIASNYQALESEPFQISFEIKRPFWFSAWFYTLMALCLIGLIYLWIKQREKKLKIRQEILEKTVEERTAEVTKQKQEVEQKQQEITDSIIYAKRIQDALLPKKEIFSERLKEAFVLYLPKDIVAGDFYWFESLNESNTELVFAVADCTGHGVPGAMVSVVCNNALNRAVREFKITDPGELLDSTKQMVIEQFETESTDNQSSIKDGMDIALCYLNLETKEVQFAGAYNPLWIIRENELIEIKGDKQPIGKFDNASPFKTKTFQLKEDDRIYIFSDGYADQFGGKKGKKLKTANFKKLILSHHQDKMQSQLNTFESLFMKWKGEFEQLDDVCLIGVRI